MAYMAIDMIGRVHDASAVTIDGRVCWIGAICHPNGKYTCRMEDVQECATEAEAVEWCERELTRRGFANPKVTVDR